MTEPYFKVIPFDDEDRKVLPRFFWLDHMIRTMIEAVSEMSRKDAHLPSEGWRYIRDKYGVDPEKRFKINWQKETIEEGP